MLVLLKNIKVKYIYIHICNKYVYCETTKKYFANDNSIFLSCLRRLMESISLICSIYGFSLCAIWDSTCDRSCSCSTDNTPPFSDRRRTSCAPRGDASIDTTCHTSSTCTYARYTWILSCVRHSYRLWQSYFCWPPPSHPKRADLKHKSRFVMYAFEMSTNSENNRSSLLRSEMRESVSLKTFTSKQHAMNINVFRVHFISMLENWNYGNHFIPPDCEVSNKDTSSSYRSVRSFICNRIVKNNVKKIAIIRWKVFEQTI